LTHLTKLSVRWRNCRYIG